MLDKSGSKQAIGKNIAIEQAAGKGRKQALAIALDTQRRAGGKVSPKKKKPVKKPAAKPFSPSGGVFGAPTGPSDFSGPLR